ncbi:hypothetical protein H3S74_05715 [Gilliamella sp. W8126]|uniref:hypothetical protein n=1 Tax=Gilliamella sp. W8126 TaxID=2750946 RepID=UPI0018DB9075|nr:hypothetical protein [Gilliamella sp. W8126]MBI0005723.1 hypothetical protein [Gilliamella sp. W8126]
MFDKAALCQEQITAGALRANEGNYIVTTCEVAAGVGKDDSRKPTLLGRYRRKELATKQQNVRNSPNKKI